MIKDNELAGYTFTGITSGIFDNEKIVREEFELPDNLEPINLLALGYADTEEKGSDRHKTERISLDELVTYK